MDSFDDALGDLFMECVSYVKNGQFFTPQPICDMMSEITMNGEIKDGMNVLDCACGSGRMLLSAAKKNRNLLFYGSDVDINCVKMTAINMIVNSMVGEVAHMNALSLEHWGSYHIKKVLTGTHYLPYYYITGKNETNFVQRVKNTIEQQPEKKIESGQLQFNLF